MARHLQYGIVRGHAVMNGVEMHGVSSIPGALKQPLDKHLETRMPPSSSRVPPIYRETTICYSYMCSYAYGCTEKTNRPAQVMMRRCMRYMPDDMRVKPGMSDMALDVLARMRRSGERLSPITNAILDDVRPNGPIRKQ